MFKRIPKSRSLREENPAVANGQVEEEEKKKEYVYNQE